jgi:hypothetical protein
MLILATSAGLQIVEGLVILLAIGAAFSWWKDQKVRRATQRLQQRAGASPVLAQAGDVMLLAEPLRLSHPDRAFNLSRGTRAAVDATGNVAVTRGRNLGDKAMGTLVLGPIGLFAIGNAKETTHDFRELYLTVSSPDVVIPFHSDLGVEVRTLAQAINSASGAM